MSGDYDYSPENIRRLLEEQIHPGENHEQWRRRVDAAQKKQDLERKIAEAEQERRRKEDEIHPYMPGTLYGLIKRANLFLVLAIIFVSGCTASLLEQSEYLHSGVMVAVVAATISVDILQAEAEPGAEERARAQRERLQAEAEQCRQDPNANCDEHPTEAELLAEQLAPWMRLRGIIDAMTGMVGVWGQLNHSWAESMVRPVGWNNLLCVPFESTLQSAMQLVGELGVSISGIRIVAILVPEICRIVAGSVGTGGINETASSDTLPDLRLRILGQGAN